MIILFIFGIVVAAIIIAALLIGIVIVGVLVFVIFGFLSSLGGGGETIGRNYPSERMSPIRHNVSGYTRVQNGKTVNVRSYTRGSR